MYSEVQARRPWRSAPAMEACANAPAGKRAARSDGEEEEEQSTGTRTGLNAAQTLRTIWSKEVGGCDVMRRRERVGFSHEPQRDKVHSSICVDIKHNTLLCFPTAVQYCDSRDKKIDHSRTTRLNHEPMTPHHYRRQNQIFHFKVHLTCSALPLSISGAVLGVPPT